MRLEKVTSSGAHMPIEIYLKRIAPEIVLKHQIAKNRVERNSWCLRGKPCAKYDTRPCCPPRVKMFSEYKPRKYMYLMETILYLDDYYRVYPNVKESKSWAYFGMDGTHKMTRGISNKVIKIIAQKFGGQAFRVGGCLGCQYHKTGKCNYFMPPLESAGVDLSALSLEVFDREILWAKPKKPMEYMLALGGLYTDAEIPKIAFKEVILDVCR